MLDIILLMLQNIIVVGVSVTLFIGLFFLFYVWRHEDSSHKSHSINYRLEHFFASKTANMLVFTWAAAEAVIWFVIPEFLLLLVLFMRPWRKNQLVFYDIYGTALGTIIALVIAWPRETLSKLPYVYPDMIDQANRWFNDLGILALLHQPFSGVPFKVFAHMAPEYELFIPLFVIFAVIVRVSRYYLAFAILQALYPLLHRYVYRNYIILAVIATVVFSLLLMKVSLTYS